MAAFKNIAEKFWDILVGWLFTTSGAVVLSTVGGTIMTVLSYFTQALAQFAPLAYGLIFILSIFLLLLLIALVKKLFGEKAYKIETFIELYYDAKTLHFESKKNIWGWRVFPTELTQLPDGTIQQSWIVSVCFNKPIQAHTVKVSLQDSGGTSRIPVNTLNFEGRYSNIQLFLTKFGKYKIEYHCHES